MAPIVRSLSVPDDSENRAPPVGEAETSSAAIINADSLASGSDVRRRLLTAAEAAFVRDGYDKARLSDIAGVAGMSKKRMARPVRKVFYPNGH